MSEVNGAAELGGVLFAGGGTGGHVFPMVAVADAVKRLAHTAMVFVGTERGLEAKVVPARGYRLLYMKVFPLRGAGVFGAAKGFARAVGAVAEARALLLAERPRVVFSAGGYAAGPISLAARLLGIPVALMEPNSVAGLANRLMAPFVQRAYTAFERSEKHFSELAVLRAGVPIRAGFHRAPYHTRGPESALKVLVLGGSQGARTLNQAVPEALARSKQTVQVRHQCGKESASEVEARYRELGMAARANVLSFIDDMPEALAWADLVISRSGASAVSEICAVGRPSILVPYPFAAGDHQRYNAEALEAAGAALSLLNQQATSDALVRALDGITQAPGALPRMAARAAQLGRPEAASRIALDLLRLGGIPVAEAPENLARGPAERDNGAPMFRFSEVH
ncbi:MAG: undecaprenyldiphospho-muramoylpentapeptide beta-N-acetylglucosaminyltransferase [Polyangiaceae bacterium]|nr:undecaprenyldiphospho-muramoylpentapeptide beta-N-acetylglucosaminyltransferase [Polyangiaceae bacterium]